MQDKNENSGAKALPEPALAIPLPLPVSAPSSDLPEAIRRRLGWHLVEMARRAGNRNAAP